MFDLFSKFGEIKEKANKVKDDLISKEFTSSNTIHGVSIKTNGKKDITSIKLTEDFHKLSIYEQETVLLETIQMALNQSETYAISSFKDIIPNIPGLNIFG
jgi:DNA-binding protein YbaB